MTSTLPVDVLYLDPSPAGRAAFVAQQAEALRVTTDPDDADVDVVILRHRGGDVGALLDAHAGRQRLLLVSGADAACADTYARAGRCEQVLVLPTPGALVALAARTAAQAAAARRRERALADLLLDRDRLATIAATRGELLHDLANLTTVASVDLELLARATAGSAAEPDVAELNELARRMVALHLRARTTTRAIERDAQPLVFAELVDAAASAWTATRREGGALLVDGPADVVVYADRLDVVRLLLALGDLCVRGGVPPRVQYALEGGTARLVPDGLADPEDLPFALATRLVEANEGRWEIDGGSLVCHIPARS